MLRRGRRGADRRGDGPWHRPAHVHQRRFLPRGTRLAELRPLEQIYMHLLRREIPVRGGDYCEMTGDYGKRIEDFAILNVMLPRVSASH